MKKLYIILLAISSSFIIGCGNDEGKFDASGVFEATEIIVSSEAAGRILQFEVKEGDVLKAGQVVGIIDSTQLYLKKQQLLASRKAVQSRRPEINTQIAVTEQQIQTAKTERTRIENLLKSNAATQKQLDDVNAQINLFEKQLAAQRSTLTSASTGVTEESSSMEIQIAQIEDQLHKSRIVNPINGTLLTKYAEVNEVTAPGKALYKIADVNNIYLRVYLSSDQFNKVKIGQNVKVYSDYGKNDYKQYEGTITWISNKAEFTPKTIQTKDERANLVYAVKVAVKNDGLLKIGMYGEVKL
ncbi:MAG TPA: HlyD family efflux transporter periplasmic adaptor subunit [Ignavibacteriaceae bacterium]|nr:HlyD family efflux transporter periplasmic adaptor subunit [Ignavibacteriaceae bacterium]